MYFDFPCRDKNGKKQKSIEKYFFYPGCLPAMPQVTKTGYSTDHKVNASVRDLSKCSYVFGPGSEPQRTLYCC